MAIRIENGGKPKPKTPPPHGATAFNKAICARIRDARENTLPRMSQKEMAAELGAGHDQYRKWEERSPPPAFWQARIIDYWGMDPWWYLTGQHRRPGAPQPRPAAIGKRPFPAPSSSPSRAKAQR